jgi:Fe-S cluster assembly iron-binding protein IscA
MEDDMIQISTAAREEIARNVSNLDEANNNKAIRVYIAGHG